MAMRHPRPASHAPAPAHLHGRQDGMVQFRLDLSTLWLRTHLQKTQQNAKKLDLSHERCIIWYNYIVLHIYIYICIYVCVLGYAMHFVCFFGGPQSCDVLWNAD